MKITAADQMTAVQIMEGLCHLPKSRIRINHYHFRCLERLACFQFPFKSFWMDSHNHANCIKFRHFCLRHKITGIHKMHGIDFPHILIGSRCHQCQKRMLLMAAFPSPGTHLMSSAGQRITLDLTFSRPCPGQCQHLKILIIHIQTCTEHLFQKNRFLTMIYNADTPCDGIHIFKNRIFQNHFQFQYFIPQMNIQSLTGLRISEGRRESFQLWLAISYLIILIMQFAGTVPVLCPDCQCRFSVVSKPCCRIFLWKTAHKRSLFPQIRFWCKRRLIRAQQIRCCQILHPFTIIDMAKIISILCQSTEIRGTLCAQSKYFLFLIIHNSHFLLPPSPAACSSHSSGRIPEHSKSLSCNCS